MSLLICLSVSDCKAVCNLYKFTDWGKWQLEKKNWPADLFMVFKHLERDRWLAWLKLRMLGLGSFSPVATSVICEVSNFYKIHTSLQTLTDNVQRDRSYHDPPAAREISAFSHADTLIRLYSPLTHTHNSGCCCVTTALIRSGPPSLLAAS